MHAGHKAIGLNTLIRRVQVAASVTGSGTVTAEVPPRRCDEQLQVGHAASPLGWMPGNSAVEQR